jgi:hypothetical protein
VLTRLLSLIFSHNPQTTEPQSTITEPAKAELPTIMPDDKKAPSTVYMAIGPVCPIQLSPEYVSFLASRGR